MLLKRMICEATQLGSMECIVVVDMEGNLAPLLLPGEDRSFDEKVEVVLWVPHLYTYDKVFQQLKEYKQTLDPRVRSKV